MDSYLKGREKAQRFHVKVAAKPDTGLDALKAASAAEQDIIVRAEAAPGTTIQDMPDVDLIMREGVVRRIVIHLEDGRRLELDCVYPGDED